MSITQKYMKKVNAFDLIYFGGTNIILLCNIYVYKYIPLRNSFCESSSADLLTLQLFLKIHLYFTDAQPQPPHFVDLWPKTNSSRSKSSPLRQSNILCSINIFHFSSSVWDFFQNYFNRYFLWPRQLPHAKRDRVVFHSFLYWTHLLFDIYVHCTSLQSSIEFSKKSLTFMSCHAVKVFSHCHSHVNTHEYLYAVLLDCRFISFEWSHFHQVQYLYWNLNNFFHWIFSLVSSSIF